MTFMWRLKALLERVGHQLIKEHSLHCAKDVERRSVWDLLGTLDYWSLWNML